MSRTDEIVAAAMSIASNARMIADNPRDWRDALLARLALIEKDAATLRRSLSQGQGGDR